MDLTNARATIGLSAGLTHTKQGVAGTPTLGGTNTILRLTDSTSAYEIRAIFAGPSDVLELDLTNGSTTGSTTWVTGAAQVETATAAGTITTAGNAVVTVTSAGMSGSPLAVTFAVALNDTASEWAAKARTALQANATIAARFQVGGFGTSIVLLRLPLATYVGPPTGFGAFYIHGTSDGTFNIALADDTSAGITEAATSAATVAGTATDGVLIFGKDEDFEGVNLPITTVIHGLKIVAEGGPFQFVGSVSEAWEMNAGEVHQQAAIAGISTDGAYTITATGSGALTITVLGD